MQDFDLFTGEKLAHDDVSVCFKCSGLLGCKNGRVVVHTGYFRLFWIHRKSLKSIATAASRAIDTEQDRYLIGGRPEK